MSSVLTTCLRCGAAVALKKEQEKDAEEVGVKDDDHSVCRTCVCV